MSIDDTRLLTRIAEALERIVYLLETEPVNVKIPNLHPSMTQPSDAEIERDYDEIVGRAIEEDET